MGIRIGIGKIVIGQGSPSQYWTTLIKSLFDSLWVNSVPVGNALIDISGNNQNIAITGTDFSTNYIPSTSSATFKMPNVAGLITDDADNLWYTNVGAQESLTPAIIVERDYTRTLVWYSNNAPYNIYAIGLLKSSVTLTQTQIDTLTQAFKLWFLWSGDGIPNDYGFGKDNRVANPTLPTVVTATIEDANKDKLILTFSEDLATDSIPVTTVFTVTSKTVSSVAISGAVVTLTVSVAWAGGETVTVGYARPTGNPLISIYGGLVATFSNQAISNNIPTIPATLNDTTKTVGLYDFMSYVTKDGSDHVSKWANKLGVTASDLNATGTPHWSSDGIVFDGTCYIKSGAFTFIQPEFLYLVIKPTAWDQGRVFVDGHTLNSMFLQQWDSTPKFYAFAGSISAFVPLSLNTWHIVRVLFNGASSKIIVDGGTPVTFSCGTSNAGGLNLGQDINGGTLHGKFNIKEVIARNVADSSGDESDIYNYLKTKYSL